MSEKDDGAGKDEMEERVNVVVHTLSEALAQTIQEITQPNYTAKRTLLILQPKMLIAAIQDHFDLLASLQKLGFFDTLVESAANLVEVFLRLHGSRGHGIRQEARIQQ